MGLLHLPACTSSKNLRDRYPWALLPFKHKAFGCRDSSCAAYEEGKLATPVLIHVLPKQGWWFSDQCLYFQLLPLRDASTCPVFSLHGIFLAVCDTTDAAFIYSALISIDRCRVGWEMPASFEYLIILFLKCFHFLCFKFGNRSGKNNSQPTWALTISVCIWLLLAHRACGCKASNPIQKHPTEAVPQQQLMLWVHNHMHPSPGRDCNLSCP